VNDANNSNSVIKDSAIVGDVNISQITNDPNALLDAFIRGREYSVVSENMDASIISSELLEAIRYAEKFSINKAFIDFNDDYFTLSGYCEEGVTAVIVSNTFNAEIASQLGNSKQISLSILKEIALSGKIQNFQSHPNKLIIKNKSGLWELPSGESKINFPSIIPEISFTTNPQKISNMLQQFDVGGYQDVFLGNTSEGDTWFAGHKDIEIARKAGESHLEMISENPTALGGRRCLCSFNKDKLRPLSKFDAGTEITIKWGSDMPLYFASKSSTLAVVGFVAPLNIDWEDHY